ncbi:hypothetical protein HK101_002695, partial [Irineochytrium annulatum]
PRRAVRRTPLLPPPFVLAAASQRTSAFWPFHGVVVFRQNADDITPGSGPYSSYAFHFTPRVLAYAPL